jgi:hypothetical protein
MPTGSYSQLKFIIIKPFNKMEAERSGSLTGVKQ